MMNCNECGRVIETDLEGQAIGDGCEYAECPMDLGFLLDEDERIPLLFDESGYTNELEPDLLDAIEEDEE